jgi:hypothetical protein
METIKYVIILYYGGGTVIRIKLTKKQQRDSRKYEDFRDYLMTLEEKYEFLVKDSEWMTCEALDERSFGF